MNRRLCLSLLTLSGLSACGFAPRKVPDFHFQRIYLAAPDTPLDRALQRQLENVAHIGILSDISEVQAGDIVLMSNGEQRERRIISENSAGEIRELALILNYSFSIHDAQGKLLLPETQISREIDQSYAEQQALSKEIEADFLFRSMQDNIVQQVMQRLATVNP